MSTTQTENITGKIYDTEGAAERIGSTKGSMEVMRCKRRGPNYVILPDTGKIVYTEAALEEYLQKGSVDAHEGPSPEQKKHQRRGGPGRPKRAAAKLRNRRRKAA